MYNQKIPKKIKWNAISAYLLLFVSIIFLFKKNDPNFNNDFVKSHTKTAFILHLSFLFIYIFFVHYNIFFWLNIQILNFPLNQIIVASLFLTNFFLLILWIYKANIWEKFNLYKSVKLVNNSKDMIWFDRKKTNFSEKDKLTIILLRIPFIWFLLFAKYKNNNLIKNIVKLNLIITLFILLNYIFWNSNLANFLSLLYIIFIVFLSINLIIKNEIININLEKIPFPSKILIYIKVFTIYIKNYILNKDFLWFKEILEKKILEEKQKDLLEEKKLSNKKDFKLINILIYVPIINIISIFNINSKLQKHIINWLILSILFWLSWFLYWFNNKIQFILLFPLSFAIWFLKENKLNYEIPFLYLFFDIINYIYKKIIKLFLFLKIKKKTEKNINLKVW